MHCKTSHFVVTEPATCSHRVDTDSAYDYENSCGGTKSAEKNLPVVISTCYAVLSTSFFSFGCSFFFFFFLLKAKKKK